MENIDVEKKDLIVQELQNLDRRVIFIMIAGAVILIAVPILATQLDWLFDFSLTGPIGDTIGGLTAPVIGVVSALLIYFSFRAQINANLIIQAQINAQKKDELEKKEFNYQMEIYKQMKEIMEGYSHRNIKDYNKLNIKFEGFRALLVDLYKEGNGYLVDDLEYFFGNDYLNYFDWIIDSCEKSMKNKYDIRLILKLTEILFRQEIWNPMLHLIEPTLNDSNEFNTRAYKIFKRIKDINLKLNSLIQDFDKVN